MCVADATNLRLHLRFVLELKRLGRPMVLALNMMDAAQKRGIVIDVAALERGLGMPVVETVAVQNGGAAALISRLDAMPHLTAAPPVGAPEGAMLFMRHDARTAHPARAGRSQVLSRGSLTNLYARSR